MILQGDVLSVLPTLADESVHCCITSPPYWGLRDYGVDGQLGLEPTPDEYVARMVAVFREVWRVLRDDGTLWLNLGDSYIAGQGGRQSACGEMPAKALYKGANPHARDDVDTGSWGDRDATAKMTPARGSTDLKPKDLAGIPWMVAFALRADGWYLRSDIIWAKPNPMPESVTDRPTKAHEYLFLMSKSPRYWYDIDAIREEPLCDYPVSAGGSFHEHEEDMVIGQRFAHIEHGAHCVNHAGGRNRRTVWTVATQPFSEAHFATFPKKLIEPCVLAGCPAGGTVLDPFTGSGTTGVVAINNHREFVGIELNPDYVAMAEKRIARETAQQSLVLEMK